MAFATAAALAFNAPCCRDELEDVHEPCKMATFFSLVVDVIAVVGLVIAGAMACRGHFPQASKALGPGLLGGAGAILMTSGILFLYFVMKNKD